MGAFIGFIIFCVIVYKILKALEPDEREKTDKIVDDCYNDTKTTSTSRKKNTTENTSTSGKKHITKNTSANNENEEPVSENNMPKFKYKNEAYISFIKKVYKAFEDFKAVGEVVMWVDEGEGFKLIRETSKFMDPDALRRYEFFDAFVYRNDDNELNLTNPYYLGIRYYFLIDKSDLDYYRDFCEYMNNYNRTHKMFSRELFMAHEVFINKYAETIEYWSNIFLTDHNFFDDKIKEFGEGAVFDQLFKIAKEKYIGGRELYETRNE